MYVLGVYVTKFVKIITIFVIILTQIHTNLSASGGLTQKYKEITDIILDAFVKSPEIAICEMCQILDAKC